MKIDEQWECWTLWAIKIAGTYRGEEGTTPTCDQGLSRRSLRVKPPTSWAGKWKWFKTKTKQKHVHSWTKTYLPLVHRSTITYITLCWQQCVWRFVGWLEWNCADNPTHPFLIFQVPRSCQDIPRYTGIGSSIRYERVSHYDIYTRYRTSHCGGCRCYCDVHVVVFMRHRINKQYH